MICSLNRIDEFISFFDLIHDTCDTLRLNFNSIVSQLFVIKSKKTLNSSIRLKLHIIIYAHLFIIFIFTTTK